MAITGYHRPSGRPDGITADGARTEGTRCFSLEGILLPVTVGRNQHPHVLRSSLREPGHGLGR